MKLIILTFIASLLLSETHNFREVNHHGKTLKNVQLVLNNSQLGFDIWYKDKLLKNGKYMIISCRTKEGFCLIEKSSLYSWIEEK